MNKTTIENAVKILDSFKEGQGKTFDSATGFKLTDKLNTVDGLSYNLNGAIITFVDESHKEAMFEMLFYKEHKDKAFEKVQETFTYLSSGKYLSMNHRDAASVKVSIETNIISQYPELEVLGFTRLVKSSNRSSLYILEKDVNIGESDITAVTALGFTELTPVVQGLKIVLKALLPVVEETTETK